MDFSDCADNLAKVTIIIALIITNFLAWALIFMHPAGHNNFLTSLPDSRLSPTQTLSPHHTQSYHLKPKSDHLTHHPPTANLTAFCDSSLPQDTKSLQFLKAPVNTHPFGLTSRPSSSCRWHLWLDTVDPSVNKVNRTLPYRLHILVR